MSNKIGIVFYILLALAFVLVVVQRHNVKQLETAVYERAQSQHVIESYVLSSFDAGEFQGKAGITEICLPHLSETSLVLFLPSGLCRACFSSLIFAFQDRNIPGNRITVISEREDIEVKAECLARGIHYLVNNQPVDSVSSILLFRLYQGFLPVALCYNVSREPLLSLFLSDDDRLFQVLSGND